MANGLIPELTINGSFGQLYNWDGKWLTQIDDVEFHIKTEFEQIRMTGTRKTAHKAKSVEGTGTLRGFHVTSDFLKTVGEMMRNDRQIQFIGTLVVTLDDPEAIGVERVSLKGVKFWEYAGGFKVNEIVKDEIPITFFDYELIDAIDGDPSSPRYDRYVAFQESGS